MFNRFVFNYNLIFYQHIDTITCINQHSFIPNRESEFTNNAKPQFAQFIFKAFLVCGFQQSGSQNPMDTDCGANDSCTQRIKIHVDAPVQPINTL